MKKIHSDFQKLQNIGNYNGPILQQIKQVMSTNKDGGDGSKSMAKTSSRIYSDLQTYNKSQTNIYFENKDLNISSK